MAHDMSPKLDLSRQEMIVDPLGIARLMFLIIGGGSIGSNVAYMLSRMGAAEASIHIYDFDHVSMENVAPARFSIKQLNQLKVLAIREGIREELGIDTIVPHPLAYKGERFPGTVDIVVSCPDNMRARRAVWGSTELRWHWLIDARMGGDQAEVYVVGPGREGAGSTLYQDVILYEDTELMCGEKATAPVSAGIIPGLVCAAVANIANGQAPAVRAFFAMNSNFGAVLQIDRGAAPREEEG